MLECVRILSIAAVSGEQVVERTLGELLNKAASDSTPTGSATRSDPKSERHHRWRCEG
jgi:hypothetical protein